MTTTRLISPSEPKPAEEHAAGFVLYRFSRFGGPEFLLLRHSNGGHWGFPKGRIEPGETELEAALRETREETGLAGSDLEIVPDLRLETYYAFARDGHPVSKSAVYFAARVAGGTVVCSEEHSDAQWLLYEAALDAQRFEEAKQCLRAVRARIQDLGDRER